MVVSGQSGRDVPAVKNSVYCSSYSAPRRHAAAARTKLANSKTAAWERNFVVLTKSQYFKAISRRVYQLMVNGVLMQDVFPRSTRPSSNLPGRFVPMALKVFG